MGIDRKKSDKIEIVQQRLENTVNRLQPVVYEIVDECKRWVSFDILRDFGSVLVWRLRPGSSICFVCCSGCVSSAARRRASSRPTSIGASARFTVRVLDCAGLAFRRGCDRKLEVQQSNEQKKRALNRLTALKTRVKEQVCNPSLRLRCFG